MHTRTHARPHAHKTTRRHTAQGGEPVLVWERMTMRSSGAVQVRDANPPHDPAARKRQRGMSGGGSAGARSDPVSIDTILSRCCVALTRLRFGMFSKNVRNSSNDICGSTGGCGNKAPTLGKDDYCK